MLVAPGMSRALATTVAFLAAGSMAASVAPAQAATYSPPDPVAGDTVTVTGYGSECYSGTSFTAVYTGKFERRNADGSYTTVASGTPQSGPSGQTYSAQLTQTGSYRGGID